MVEPADNTTQMTALELKNFEALKAWIGKQLPNGAWFTVDQEMINDFAKATLDFQWIHTDVEKATKYSPFKKPVAHGFLSLSLLSKMIGDVVKVDSLTMGVNYGLNKVRFPSAVMVEDKVRFTGRIAEMEPYGDNGLKIVWNCAVEIKDNDKPACVAEFISLMFE